MPYSIRINLIPYVKPSETVYTYDAENGIATMPDGTQYTIAEMVALAKNDIPPNDLNVIHRIKNIFKGDLVFMKLRTHARPFNPEEMIRKYKKWMHTVCVCGSNQFQLEKVPDVDICLCRCIKCNRAAGSMSDGLARMIISCNPYFKRAKQEDILGGEK